MYTVRIIASNQPAETVEATHPRAAARAIQPAPGTELVVSTTGSYYRYRVATNGRIIEIASYSA